MPLSWKIEYTAPGEAAVDITALCDGFSVTCRMDSFVREMTLDILDKDFYDGLDFDTVPADPAVEISTKTEDTWFSQGKFFLERPGISAYPRSDEVRSVWGRSETARLAEPFADKITKVWETDTTFFAIAAELCTACGLTFDETKSDVVDFLVFARTFEADQQYPAEILSELCMLAGAVLSCDRTGDVFIRAADYAPSSADVAVVDADIRNITETPIYPSFGNRVKIMPTGATAGYGVSLYVADPCLSARTSFKKPVFARVTDSNGDPLTGIPVDWTLTYEGGVNGLAKLEYPVTNTRTIRFFREKKRSDSFYKFSTQLPPASILGVYAFADAARQNNFAAGGVTIDGTEVTLADPLDYCDQTIVVDYVVDGIAVNYLVNDNAFGVAGQTATLAADVQGQSDETEIYINNECRCPVTLTIRANPPSVPVGTTCDVLVYAEESGGPVLDGRQVFLQLSQVIGQLKDLAITLGSVAVTNEQTQAVNVVSGITQCELSMFPASVYGVWVADDTTGEGLTRSGDNLYVSHVGKTVILSAALATGTPLLIDYWSQGAAKTLFRGGTAGSANILAYMASNSESGVSAYTTVSVYDPSSPYTQSTPPNWSPYPTTPSAWTDPGTFPDPVTPAPPTAAIDCQTQCEEQYPAGDDRDQCIEDCDESNDPSNKNEDGEGFDETDSTADCEGQECADGEVCCATEFQGTRGCHPESQCFGSAPPDPDLTCEEQCQVEYDAWGTTGVYDDGSMRTIDRIVIDDYGYEAGSPGYHEKYDELKAEALQECIDDCEECEDVEALSTDAPETMAPDSDAYIVISGGKGPFTVNLTEGADNGFSIAVDGREIVLSQSADGCGSATITITDACGQELEVQIRSTSGTWVEIPGHSDPGDPCVLTRPPHDVFEAKPPETWIVGKIKQFDDISTSQQLQGCGYCNGSACCTPYDPDSTRMDVKINPVNDVCYTWWGTAYCWESFGRCAWEWSCP